MDSVGEGSNLGVDRRHEGRCGLAGGVQIAGDQIDQCRAHHSRVGNASDLRRLLRLADPKSDGNGQARVPLDPGDLGGDAVGDGRSPTATSVSASARRGADDGTVDKGATGMRFRPVNNEWPAGRYRVVLRGDYVLAERTITKTANDGSTFEVQAVLDGNHLAPGILGPGGIGPRGLPARCPSGDWVEGGTFESWFEIVKG